jgi:hypothetical protein
MNILYPNTHHINSKPKKNPDVLQNTRSGDHARSDPVVLALKLEIPINIFPMA